MSHNSQTKLSPTIVTGTIGTSTTLAVSTLTTSTKVYDLLFGGSTIGGTLTVGNDSEQVAPVTTSSPFSVASKSIDKQHIPLDPSDWVFSGSNGDVVWVMFLEEKAATL